MCAVGRIQDPISCDDGQLRKYRRTAQFATPAVGRVSDLVINHSGKQELTAMTASFL
jgi:hypothetical protein